MNLYLTAMSERDNESFDLDEEFLGNVSEDSTDYDRLLDRVDKRVRTQGKKGKAAWSKLEEVLADRKLEKDLQESFDDGDEDDELVNPACGQSPASSFPLHSPRTPKPRVAPRQSANQRRSHLVTRAHSPWIVLKFGGTSVSIASPTGRTSRPS